MAPVSHSILRNRPIDENHKLDSNSIKVFDNFANFYRNHRSGLDCKQPPCINNDDIENSITYLLVTKTKEDSPCMQQLYNFLHSDKHNLIESGVQDHKDVQIELYADSVMDTVHQARERVLQQHPNLNFFMHAAIEPIQVYIDILRALVEV